MGGFKFLVLVFLLIDFVMGQSFNSSEFGIEEREDRGLDVLSRRKRFIVFPEGSSFQIVFCETFPTIFTIGDIFLFGYTAALAYELPQDPYSPFMHHGDPLHRRMDSKTIYFTDYHGKVLFKKKYQRKPIVNPAFAKRSADMNERFKKGTQQKFKMDRKRMHALTHRREFLKREHMEERSAEFHRSGRAALFPKIETVLEAMGSNGKHCVLRTLCQVGQTQHHHQGSFFQEIMRAVFTLPKGKYSEELKEYDDAHSATESCAALYPDCEEEPSSNRIPKINS